MTTRKSSQFRNDSTCKNNSGKNSPNQNNVNSTNPYSKYPDKPNFATEPTYSFSLMLFLSFGLYMVGFGYILLVKAECIYSHLHIITSNVNVGTFIIFALGINVLLLCWILNSQLNVNRKLKQTWEYLDYFAGVLVDRNGMELI